MEERIYLIANDDTLYGTIPDCREYLTLYGWSVVSFPKNHYDFIASKNIKYYEITLDDILAFKLFGDPRPVVKVDTADELEQDEIYLQYGGDISELGERVKLEVSPSRRDNVIKNMKKFAIILLEEEFNKRYLKFKQNTTELESSTWDQQIMEVEKYDSGLTSETDIPLLHTLSTSYGNSLSEMVSLVKQAKQSHDVKSQELYAKFATLKTEFNSCSTIDDINLLYMRYFSLSMPFTKEFKLSRQDLFDERGGHRNRLGVGYQF